jgi:thiamine transport system permease protein
MTAQTVATRRPAGSAHEPVPDRLPALESRRLDRVAAVSRRVGLVAIGLVPAAVLAVFFVYPVASIVGRGLAGAHGMDWRAFTDVLGRSRFQRIAIFTVWQAAASAALSLSVGVPMAHLLYRRRFAGRRVLRALIAVPFVLPTVVVGLAFRTLLAPSGWLAGLHADGTVYAILAAHLFFNVAVVVRTVGAAWEHLDTRPAEAARSLGAGPLRTMITVTLPSIGPAVAAAGTMVFLFCATSFGVVLVLGGSRYSTLETEIYRQTSQVGDLRTAAVLSILQLVLVAAVLVVAGRLRRRTERRLRLRGVRETVRPLTVRDLPAIAVGLLAAVVIVVPMAVLVARSFQTAGGWGLDNYRNLGTAGEHNVLLVSGVRALTNSIQAALLAAAISVVVGVLLCVVLARRPRAARARRAIAALDGLMMLPLGVSAVTLGFGFLVALDHPPVDLRSSALLVPLAQAMVVTPLVVRMVLPVLRSADDRLRPAAAVLGASPVRAWAGVDLPMMGRALVGASAFALAMALGEFGATSFVARPETITLPVMIGRLIDRPGPVNTGMALAASTLLAVVCALVVVAIDLVGTRDPGDDRSAAGRMGVF